MSARSPLEAALVRDRWLVGGALALVIALSWAWIVPMALDMYGSMSGASAWMMSARWDLQHYALLAAMWFVMMCGMMLPSAAPAILIYAAVVRNSEHGYDASRRAAVFTAGYLAVWAAFSIAATALQVLLTTLAWVSPMMEVTRPWLAGALLVAAGVYQLTPLKQSCLASCRSPARFLTEHWRSGRMGAWRMGIAHGIYCVGCCWVLMLLLFVGGVMSLICIAAIGVFVLAEKVAPLPAQSGRWSGAALILAGLWMMAAPKNAAAAGDGSPERCAPARSAPCGMYVQRMGRLRMARGAAAGHLLGQRRRDADYMNRASIEPNTIDDQVRVGIPGARSDVAARSRERAGVAAESGAQMQPTVFVVDDDPGVLRALTWLLSLEFTVKAFASGAPLLEAVRPGTPGCIVLDLALPDISGLELQAQLIAAGCLQPVIFLSGRGSVRTSVQAMRAGAMDFIEKPWENDVLISSVRRALDRDREIRMHRDAVEPISQRLASLTPREHEVFRQVIAGRLNKQIAVILGTAEKTVKVHRARVMHKMLVRSVAELTRAAELMGIRPDP